MQKTQIPLINKILKNPSKYITRDSISIVGANYDSEFKILTITGDGFAMARFVFSHDFEKFRFVFGQWSWKDNHKAEIPPYALSISVLEKYLIKIKV